MAKSLSERRLIENELLFRDQNENLARGFLEFEQMAKADGTLKNYPGLDSPLPFYCECADSHCRQRISLTPKEYMQLHKQNTQFVVLPGHITPGVERRVKGTRHYIVVEKFKIPETSELKTRLLKTKKPKSKTAW